MEPVRFALVGLGGYGKWMAQAFFDELDRATPLVRFVAAADPNLAGHPQLVDQLKQHGVRLYPTFEDILQQADVEAVWLPVPIDLHRPFTEKTMAAGKVAVVEKPVTGSIDDLNAMIAERDRLGGRAAVGFQDIYLDTTLQAKQRLLDGAIGRVRSATLHACVPRPERYYGRTAWAGKKKHNGAWVLDSPANNAVAHYINLALFFLGQSMPAMAKLESVTAELYRVHEIENYDTCSMRIITEGDLPLLVHLTHACSTSVPPHLTLNGDRGVMRYVAGKSTEFEAGGAMQSVELTSDARSEMVQKLARWIRGDKSVIPVSLEMSGAHLAVINGASEASPVRRVAGYTQHTSDEGDVFRVLPGIETLFDRCSAEQKMLSELADVPWALPGGFQTLDGYTRFLGPA